jgi:hypothetical protein
MQEAVSSNDLGRFERCWRDRRRGSPGLGCPTTLYFWTPARNRARTGGRENCFLRWNAIKLASSLRLNSRVGQLSREFWRRYGGSAEDQP